MRKMTLGFAAILLAALFVLAACDANPANSEFVGRWLRWDEQESSPAGAQIYVFHPDGDGVFHDGRFVDRGLHETPIIWNIYDDRLEIFFGGQLRANIYYFEFEDDDTLLLRRVGWPEGTGSVLARVDD